MKVTKNNNKNEKLFISTNIKMFKDNTHNRNTTKKQTVK